MANIVFQIGGGAEADQRDLEVYRDISVTSQRTTGAADRPDVEDYMQYVVTEDGEYVVQDEDENGVGTELDPKYHRKLDEYTKNVSSLPYRIDRLVNVKAVQNSLRQIFTWLPGERVLNPEFGSKVRIYLYEQITDANRELIAAEIRSSVSEWEPRAQIDDIVNIVDINDTEHNTVRLEILYHIAGLDDQQFRYMYEQELPRYEE